MDVSIVIVAWNVKELLHSCLSSVFDQTKGIAFEVVYVDNASVDGSVDMVAAEFPAVRILRNEKNEGFIRASNQGIEASDGRYVLLLNSDTVILDNAIAKMVEFADAHPEAGVVGCKVFHPDGSLQRSCFMYPSILSMFLSVVYLYKLFPRSRFFGREMMTWWDFDDVRQVQAVCGCCSLVRREAIRQVGLMDEIYFFYGDEADWCYRFEKSGWKNMFMPYAKIIHYGGATTKRMPDTFRLQLCGSHLIFMRLHRSKPAFACARLLMALFLFVRVPYWYLNALFNKEKRQASIKTGTTYLAGAGHCLNGWKNLLMNKEAVAKKL
jgi:hypothetical protein